MTPYDTFRIYYTLRLHFQGKGNYLKYGPKLPYLDKIYRSRSDKNYFDNLSRRYATSEIEDVFVSVLIKDNQFRMWKYDKEALHQTYVDWSKRRQQLLRHFITEMQGFKALTDARGLKLLDLLKPREDGAHPILIQAYLQGLTSPEVLVILNQIFKFKSHYDTVYDDDTWKAVSLLIQQYSPFVKFDLAIYQKALNNVFQANIPQNQAVAN